MKMNSSQDMEDALGSEEALSHGWYTSVKAGKGLKNEMKNSMCLHPSFFTFISTSAFLLVASLLIVGLLCWWEVPPIQVFFILL